jgi:aryl-alcohol dehydrogenase-like predicted oxidoreductase
VKKIEELAAAKGCTPSQLALAWVLAQGKDVVPIPGTKRVKYLDDNLGAVNVRLTADDLAQIDAILPAGVAAGSRYSDLAMQVIDR